MPGRAQAVQSGKDLELAVAEIGLFLGLDIKRQVRVGKRIWGAERRIDVVLRHPETRQSIGLECKYQGSPGSAEEKIPTTIEDIRAWPIKGLVVFAGEGFSPNMVSFLHATGMAVELGDLEMWLRLFFGLDM
ncbi:MAG: hypothetical protein JW910_15515 [Anaerolineae bacterium]|nr:hypothetical protein [Anaerolineae bacterium]